MNKRSFLTSLFAIGALLTSARADEKQWLTFEGKDGPGHGKHIVFLAGDEEYRSEEALPMLAKILSQRHGFKCTVLFPVGADGVINPDNGSLLAGAEALDSADVIVTSLRFRHWPDETMKHFVDAYKAGKSIVGLRTSTHAFSIKEGAYKDYSAFGKKVLGEGWVSHWGAHKSQATRGFIQEAAKNEAILNGVSDIFCWSDVYEAFPPDDAKILIRGAVLAGMKPTDEVLKGKVKATSKKTEQDLNEPMMPIAWTREYKNEAGNTNKILCTTTGAATDLLNESLRRLVVNAVFWGAGLEIPKSADVTFVDEYKPSFFGFKGYRKGLKPADLDLGKVMPGEALQPPDSVK